jgi:hypothetical protein
MSMFEKIDELMKEYKYWPSITYYGDGVIKREYKNGKSKLTIEIYKDKVVANAFGEKIEESSIEEVISRLEEKFTDKHF